MDLKTERLNLKIYIKIHKQKKEIYLSLNCKFKFQKKIF